MVSYKFKVKCNAFIFSGDFFKRKQEVPQFRYLDHKIFMHKEKQTFNKNLPKVITRDQSHKITKSIEIYIQLPSTGCNYLGIP
jgi:hypothetical protein